MPAVFVFDSDGDLDVFSSLGAAEGYMEAGDVEDGEYGDAFLHDGTVVKMGVTDERLVLTPSAVRDAGRLDRAIDECQRKVVARLWSRREDDKPYESGERLLALSGSSSTW